MLEGELAIVHRIIAQISAINEDKVLRTYTHITECVLFSYADFASMIFACLSRWRQSASMGNFWY